MQGYNQHRPIKYRPVYSRGIVEIHDYTVKLTLALIVENIASNRFIPIKNQFKSIYVVANQLSTDAGLYSPALLGISALASALDSSSANASSIMDSGIACLFCASSDADMAAKAAN